MIGKIAEDIAIALANYIDEQIDILVSENGIDPTDAPPKVCCIHDPYFRSTGGVQSINDDHILVYVQKINVYPHSTDTNVGTFTIYVEVNDTVTFTSVGTVLDLCYRFVQNTFNELNTTDDYVIHFGKSLFAWKESKKLTFHYIIQLDFLVTTKRY